MSAQGARFGCPECGGERIREQNTVCIDYDVAEWDEDGEPAEYGDSEVFYDTTEREDVNPFRCRDCDHEFSQPKRLEGAQ